MGFVAAAWTWIGGLAVSVGGTSIAIGTAIQSAIISYGIGRVLETFAPDQPTDFGGTFDRSLKVNNTSNVQVIPIIYGTRIIGGSEYRAVTGTNNDFLWRVMVLSEGECDSVEAVYLNDRDISTDEEYQGLVNYEFVSGKDEQDALEALLEGENKINGWDGTFKGNGTCYIAVRLKYDSDVFSSGLPTLTVKLKGKKIYDPREEILGNQDFNDKDTYTYSDNPALCVLDYLTN